MKKQKKAFRQELLVNETTRLGLKRMSESGGLVEVSGLFSQCLKEDDSVKQCALLKKAGSLLQVTECHDEGSRSSTLYQGMNFLAEVFVICDIKNPSRRTVASHYGEISDLSLAIDLTITRSIHQGLSLRFACYDLTLSYIFDNLPKHWSSDVVSTVVLNKIRISKDALDLGTDDSLRHDVDMISDILEYFALGTDVLLCNGHFVVEFLGRSLHKQWKLARTESSPTLQTSCMWDCLVTIKTVISLLQKLSSQQNLCNDVNQLSLCDQTQNTTVETDSEQRCSSQQKPAKPWKDIMIEMLCDLCTVTFDDQFFPDCRTTAGMAIIIVIKIICSAETFVSTVGALIFPSHVEVEERPPPMLDDPKTVSLFQQCQGILSFSHLCLCRGVLTMVPLQTLAQSSEVILSNQKTGGNLMFDALFPDLCALCDSLKETSSSLLAFRTLTLWSSQARQIAVSGYFEVSWMKEKLHGTSPIPSKLLSYVWTHWDHPVEGVRYQTRMICEHVVNLHLIVAQSDSTKEAFLKDLTGSLLEVGWHVRGKYGPLACITSVVGATKMLLWFPTIPQDIYPLMKDRSLVPHVMDFVDKMANSHKQEIIETLEGIEAWLKIWMTPLLYHLQHGCRRMREHLAQYCLPKLLKCCPESLQYLIKHLQGSSEPNSQDLGTLITCLKTARSSGLISFNSKSLENLSAGKTSGLWCGVIPVELMRNALCHLDDQIRLAALGLLCDSPRTTESVTELDLQLLRVFAPANMNNQSPSFRQQAAAQLKKFFLRLRECIRICGKKVKQRENIDEKQIEEHRLALYKKFLRWFSEFQFDSLFPGASSTRRTTALSNVMLIKQIFSLEESSALTEMDSFNITEVLTLDNIFILLDCLSDSYEHNKIVAYDILMAAPPQRLPFQEEKSRHEWQDMIDRLVSSPRAVDASSAAMFLRLLVERCCLPLIFNKPKSIVTSTVKQRDEPLECVLSVQSFRVLRYLIDLLRSHCATASKNLSLIGIQAPMHGVLYCTRSILSNTSLSSVAADEHWQNLMSCLVTECFYTADIVAPVITSRSPEGFTSDDTEEGEYGEIPDQLDDMLETDSINAPASQLLLVCCWRTMKEVALLLGELAENAPLQVGNTKNGLLTATQLQAIGTFFTKVLLTSKHRGAFELAYTGFAKLCTVMWSSTVQDLSQLPEQWLQSLLDELTSAAPLQDLCGTRRSAGVPFFIQAIVTTEPCAAGRACFRRVMRELLKIASKPVEESRIRDSTLPQVHACNVLRALYRETKLGEEVFPFVSDGVVAAIKGFHSESWAMRNSSTLLFSALVTRVFGVKRAKDEHSKKNCMTGREFFSRFPELHSFLLSQLQAACQGIHRENTTHPGLYPVLVILSRLYPSTMDGVDSVLNMAKFVPLVISCRKSMVIKTRMMSARAVVPLVCGDLFIQTLLKLVLFLPVSSSHELKQNHIHGTLVQIYHLLYGHACDAAVSIKRQIVSDILPQLKNSAWLGTRNNPCALSRSVFLDIVLNFVVDWSWLDHSDSGIESELIMLAKNYLQSLKQRFENMAIEETLNEQEARAVIGEMFVRKSVAGICLRACEDYDVYREPDKSKLTSKYANVIQALLQSPEYEVRLAVLEFVISHLSSDTSTSLDCKAASSRSKAASWLLRELDSHFKPQLFTMAMKTEHHVDCLVKVFQVLSQLPDVLSFPWILSSEGEISAFECWTFVSGLLDASNQRDSLKCALLQFLSRMVSVMHGLVTSEDSVIASQAMSSLEEFSGTLLETSSPSQSVELRICTAQVLGHRHVTDVMFDSQEVLGGAPLVLWSVIVKLLCDDEPVVREEMALGFSLLSKRIPTSFLVVGCPVESCAMVPPVSVESVMQCVWCLFIHRAPVACVSWMMELIQGDLAYASFDQDVEISDVDRLFEKGPLNIYAEDCIITRIACHTVEQGIDSNGGTALLALKKHKTEVIELLKDQLEKCVVFLERLLSANRDVNRNCFGVVYRVLAGLFVVVMLTLKLHGNISSIQSRIIAVVGAIQRPGQTGGISFHVMIKACMEKLCTFITL